MRAWNGDSGSYSGIINTIWPICWVVFEEGPAFSVSLTLEMNVEVMRTGKSLPAFWAIPMRHDAYRSKMKGRGAKCEELSPESARKLSH